jgi:hypothetical protein
MTTPVKKYSGVFLSLTKTQRQLTTDGIKFQDPQRQAQPFM